MTRQGWIKAKGTALSNHSGPVTFIPDRVYIKKDKPPLIFEIKPANALGDEIKKGLGQCAWCLPFQAKPYLVLSPEQWDKFNVILALFEWLGIATYSENILEVKQKSLRLDLDDLVPINAAKVIPPSSSSLASSSLKLGQTHVWVLLKTKKLRGFYTVKEIAKLLEQEHPGYKIHHSHIGEAFMAADFKKRFYQGDVGYEIVDCDLISDAEYEPKKDGSF